MSPFDFENNPDRTLFEGIVNESINIYGLSTIYYIVNFDESKDRILSEDSKPVISAEYPMKFYAEVIQEDWVLTRFGFNSEDLIRLHIGKKEFEDTVGVGSTPKIGDYITIKYMNSRLFVITDIDEEDNVFLQKKFVWNITLKPADISGEELGPAITTLPDYENTKDDTNDNSTITDAISGIVVEKEDDQDIFGGW